VAAQHKNTTLMAAIRTGIKKFRALFMMRSIA
jgi:hypothetical protein